MKTIKNTLLTIVISAYATSLFFVTVGAVTGKITPLILICSIGWVLWAVSMNMLISTFLKEVESMHGGKTIRFKS